MYQFIRIPWGGLMSLIIVAMLVPVVAGGVSNINGEMTASRESSRPDLGSWEYTLDLSWHISGGRDLGYFDLLVDEVLRACACQDMRNAIVPGDTVGLSIPVKSPDASFYELGYICEGEEETRTLLGRQVRFLPFAGQANMPGSEGVGVFTLFSDFGPADIDYPALILVDEFGSLVCTGMVTGRFPAMTCDPVQDRQVHWGAIKSLYRHD